MTVEQFKPFSFVRGAYTDTVANVRFVECVRRLSRGEHHIVRDVDDDVNGAHADRPDQFAHGKGRLPELDAFEDDGIVAEAAVLIDDFDRVIVLQACRVFQRRKRTKRAAIDGAQFARESVMTPEVGAVCQGFVVDVDDKIVQPQNVGDGLPRFRIGEQFRQIDDFRFFVFRRRE